MSISSYARMASLYQGNTSLPEPQPQNDPYSGDKDKFIEDWTTWALEDNPDEWTRATAGPAAEASWNLVNEGSDGDSWSSTDPFSFEIVKDILQESGVSAGLASDFMNAWAKENEVPADHFAALDNPAFMRPARWLPYAHVLPPAFNYNDASYVYSATKGPQMLSHAVDDRPADSEFLEREFDPETGEMGEATGIGQGDGSIPAGTASSIEYNEWLKGQLPTLNDEILAQLVRRPSRGSGRTAAAFDKDQLVEEAHQKWRQYLLAPPPDDIGRMVDEYTRKANSFWLSKGGRLDFDTFMLGKIRATSRYGELYRHKSDSVSEEQYIGQFTRAAGSVGLGAGQTSEVAARGAIAGSTPTGTAQLAADTPSFQRSGSFSRSLANTIAQLGSGATAA